MSEKAGVYRTADNEWAWTCAACDTTVEQPFLSRDVARDNYKEHRANCPKAADAPEPPPPLVEPPEPKEKKVATRRKGTKGTKKTKGRSTKKKGARSSKRTTKKKAAKSTKTRTKGAVQKVWDICNKMPNARRKDVIEACVKAGINVHTARRQYQVWYSEATR